MKLYVIEARNPDGSLDLTDPQPEKFFGLRAVTGITQNEMSWQVFRRNPNAELTGENIPSWPSFVDPRFVARVKYW